MSRSRHMRAAGSWSSLDDYDLTITVPSRATGRDPGAAITAARGPRLVRRTRSLPLRRPHLDTGGRAAGERPGLLQRDDGRPGVGCCRPCLSATDTADGRRDRLRDRDRSSGPAHRPPGPVRLGPGRAQYPDVFPRRCHRHAFAPAAGGAAFAPGSSHSGIDAQDARFRQRAAGTVRGDGHRRRGNASLTPHQRAGWRR